MSAFSPADHVYCIIYYSSRLRVSAVPPEGFDCTIFEISRWYCPSVDNCVQTWQTFVLATPTGGNSNRKKKITTRKDHIIAVVTRYTYIILYVIHNWCRMTSTLYNAIIYHIICMIYELKQKLGEGIQEFLGLTLTFCLFGIKIIAEKMYMFLWCFQIFSFLGNKNIISYTVFFLKSLSIPKNKIIY